jgi:hypothetical protein
LDFSQHFLIVTGIAKSAQSAQKTAAVAKATADMEA